MIKWVKSIKRHVRNYVEHLLILVIGCISISAFAPAVCVPVGITSSAVAIKTLCNHCRN